MNVCIAFLHLALLGTVQADTANALRFYERGKSAYTAGKIEEAKELPAPPDPEVTRMEFDMKDQMIRNTILNTQGDVSEIKEDIRRIEEKIDKLK